jgi:chromosome partitioning protein
MLEEFAKAILELLTAAAHALISANDQDDGVAYWLKLIALVVSLVGAIFYAYYWGRKALQEKIHQVLTDPDAFWSKEAAASTRKTYRKNIAHTIPIIALANYKGGVGKSMISANLAAYFDKIGLRVLVIDYDYQGSLTDIVPYKKPGDLTFSAHQILEGERITNEVVKPHALGQSFRHSAIHPAEAGLSRIDSKLIYQWLTGERKDDIRFNTQTYLSSDFVQKGFDVVIIDTPPRICAATANALCAATHVLMPTILDTVSSRAVLRSTEMFLEFRDKLGLAFRMLGVVPSKVEAQNGYNDRESKAIDYLNDELNRYRNRTNPATVRMEPIKLLVDFPVMHKVSLLHIEGDDMKIFDPNPKPNEAVILRMFSKLGNYILEEIGLRKRPGNQGEVDADIRIAQGVLELRTSA